MLLSDCADWSEGRRPTFSKFAGWLPLLPHKTKQSISFLLVFAYKHRGRLLLTLAGDWWPAARRRAPCLSCVSCWIWPVYRSLHLCCRGPPVALWWRAEEGCVWSGERSQHQRPGRWAADHRHKTGSARERCQSDPPRTGTAPWSSPGVQVKANRECIRDLQTKSSAAATDVFRSNQRVTMFLASVFKHQY